MHKIGGKKGPKYGFGALIFAFWPREPAMPVCRSKPGPDTIGSTLGCKSLVSARPPFPISLVGEKIFFERGRAIPREAITEEERTFALQR